MIVGKRALPALGAGRARADRSPRRRLIVEPDDIAIGFGADGGDRAASRLARERGCLTIAFAPAGAEWEFDAADRRPVRPPGAGRDALPRAVGARARVLRAPRPARGPRRAAGPRRRRVELPLPVPGRARERPRGGGRRRAPLGAREGGRDRRAARADADREPRRAGRRGGRRCAATLDAGGRLLALGNGGSATDAMDVVADFRDPAPAGRRGARSTSPRTRRS